MDPGAIIEIVNSAVSVPFTGAQDNDLIISTTHSNQRMVFAISNSPIMTISNQNIDIKGNMFVSGSFTSQMPPAFNGITLARTTAATPSPIIVAPIFDSFFRDAASNLIISAGSNGYIAFNSGTSNEIARITSDGSLCIGTTIAKSKLTLFGKDSSIRGPHVTITTSNDQYPLLQMLSWSHNALYLTFDGYFDGSNWMASHATSYQMRKSSNLFSFAYSANNSPGSIATFSNALSITSNGFIGINTNSPTEALHVNGNIKLNKIISSQFRAYQIFDNRFGPLHNIESDFFTFGGGTVMLKGSFSLYNDSSSISTSTCTLSFVKSGEVTPTATIVTTFTMNIINDHRTAPISRVLNNIPSGNYKFIVSLSGTSGTTSDANDYINLTSTEYPF